jgi:hypothetical protein
MEHVPTIVVVANLPPGTHDGWLVVIHEAAAVAVSTRAECV